MIMDKTSFLVGKQIFLRSLKREDLPAMLQWTNDPEVTKYTGIGTFPNTIEALEHEYNILVNAHKTSNLVQLRNCPETLIFAIIHEDNKEHVGNVGIFGINYLHGIAELRVFIGNKEYWGRGIATEAYRLVAQYAFDRLNMRRLTGGTRIDNIGSIRAFEKLGFVREGTRRQHILRNNKAYDVADFGLMREEFNG